MIPDLRAYTVYALATTSGAPKDALDKAWTVATNSATKGLALTGLALAAASDGRAKQAADLLEKKAHVTDVDAYWEGTYDGMLDFWDDTSPETTAFALKLLIRRGSLERADAKSRALACRASRRRLLVLD